MMDQGWDTSEHRAMVKRCHQAMAPFKKPAFIEETRWCISGRHHQLKKLTGYNTEAKCFACQEKDEL